MSYLKGLRFLKRIPLWKFLTLNLSKHGLGVSIGRAGIRFGRSVTGKLYVWLGLPGTGLGYRKSVDPAKLIGWIIGRWSRSDREDQGGAKRPRLSGYLRRYEQWYRDPVTRRSIQRAKEILRDEHERKRRQWRQSQAQDQDEL